MDWHYQDPKTGERRGPASHEVMADLFRRGELNGDTLVWRDGLAAWQLASQTAEFVADAPRPTAAVAMPAGGSIGYYSPRGDTPARVLQNLRKYAQPTGPVGDWPLSDAHVAQLTEAARLRKRVLGGVAVARIVAVLACLGAISGTVSFAVLLTSPGRGGAASATLSGVLGFYLLVAIAFWAAAGAIRRCHAWASLVLAILSSLGLLAIIAGAAAAVTNMPSRDQVPMSVTFGVLAVIWMLITAVLWRSWSATPKYLKTPVWCQEAIAVTERGR